MKSKVINVLMFAAGAAIGSVVTWKVVKARYERIVQEELESIRETFIVVGPDADQDQAEESDEEGQQECAGQINWEELEDLDEEDDEDDDKVQYANIVKNYTNEKGGAIMTSKEPYVISPYDFGELDDYHQIELTYYADGILEDEEYHIVTNAEELIGPKALFTFGEYEDDSVFVRNERLMTDFQILKDYRTYSEARGAAPNKVQGE